MPTIVKNIRDVSLDDPRRVYIGRPSKWGNPFSVKGNGRIIAIARYREWVQKQPALMSALPELKGKTLVCFCAPLACHGDVLAELADAT